MTISIANLWRSRDRRLWDRGLDEYWNFVSEKNLQLERDLENLSLDRIRVMDSAAWFDFLHKEYFRWKYTAANRYATTTKQLRRYKTDGELDKLLLIKEQLLRAKDQPISQGLRTAGQIRGLGAAGASGLLALMFPREYATVDQFVVKALLSVGGLPESERLAQMKPLSLTASNGEVLIQIMANKANENNETFGCTEWTPRKIDKVLWTYGRD